MGVLIAIAGVVTPLGLYQTLAPADNVQTPFMYLRDASPFGFGTPPRSNLSFNRICDGGRLPCPFSDTIAVAKTRLDGTGTIDHPYGYDISIPKFVSDVYSSGVGNSTTVSNYFDIQWRRYGSTQDADYNNGSTYLIQEFRLMQSMALNNATEAVEGLIVDTIKGSIGFRNHTVPPGYQYGAAWEEDILFIEPETVCVNTNITLDYRIAPVQNFTKPLLDLVITDRGGFANIIKQYPSANLTDTQAFPDLYTRAYKAAWMTNTFTMLYFNVTNIRDQKTGRAPFSYLDSHVGDRKSVV